MFIPKIKHISNHIHVTYVPFTIIFYKKRFEMFPLIFYNYYNVYMFSFTLVEKIYLRSESV